MGLDVIIKRGRKDLGWSDDIMESFPFKKVVEKYPIYEGGEGYEEYVGEGEQEYIGEMCGMICVGWVSFRGRGLNDVISDLAGIQWSLYNNLSNADVKWLAKFLSEHLSEVPEERREDIGNLVKLFQWMGEHGLSTRASY